MLGPEARRRAAAQVFVEPASLDAERIVLAAEDAHHLRRVLRLRVGEQVVASDGQGRYRLCSVSNEHTVLVCDSPVANEPPPCGLTVGVPLLGGGRHDDALRGLVELGIKRIALVACARSVVRSDPARLKRRSHAVARQAAAQARRVWLPEILGPLALEDFVERVAPEGLLVAEPSAEAFPLQTKAKAVLVGPEGGFEPGELAHLAARARLVGLGPHVLRAETAAVVAGALLAFAQRGCLQ
jgi:16S rRNA (uracil1498-N3)-methyltransferase